jgi:hypothetical protein
MDTSPLKSSGLGLINSALTDEALQPRIEAAFGRPGTPIPGRPPRPMPQTVRYGVQAEVMAAFVGATDEEIRAWLPETTPEFDDSGALIRWSVKRISQTALRNCRQKAQQLAEAEEMALPVARPDRKARQKVGLAVAALEKAAERTERCRLACARLGPRSSAVEVLGAARDWHSAMADKERLSVAHLRADAAARPRDPAWSSDEDAARAAETVHNLRLRVADEHEREAEKYAALARLAVHQSASNKSSVKITRIDPAATRAPGFDPFKASVIDG